MCGWWEQKFGGSYWDSNEATVDRLTSRKVTGRGTHWDLLLPGDRYSLKMIKMGDQKKVKYSATAWGLVNMEMYNIFYKNLIQNDRNGMVHKRIRLSDQDNVSA